MNGVAFVAACFPEEKLNHLIEANDIDDIAANVFGQKICRCLALFNPSIDVINEHKSVRFPYRKKIHVAGSEDTLDNIYYHSYGYLNILFLERISKAGRIKKMLKQLKPKVVVVYSMHTPYLKPVIDLKTLLKYKVVVVVPDLPEYMVERKNRITRYLKRKDTEKLYKLADGADGFIILSRYMIDRLPMDRKKALVIEGIADDIPTYVDKNIEHENYILYSGSISAMYGLPEFINYYLESSIEEPLYICGSGPFVEELVKRTKEIEKVKYLGVVSRAELINLQRKASLLINPRSGKDEFTKYSFPSKTMEYLSSGTPVMMERLKGIPDKYYDYILEVKDGDWRASLKKFSSSDKTHLYEMAREAKEFVQNEKTIRAQANHIKNFIEEL